jgi:hypothetical protein
MLTIFRLTDGYQVIGLASELESEPGFITVYDPLKVDYSRSSASSSAIFLSRYDNFSEDHEIRLNKANIIYSSIPSVVMEEYYVQSLKFIESHSDSLVEEGMIEATNFLKRSMQLDSMDFGVDVSVSSKKTKFKH